MKKANPTTVAGCDQVDLCSAQSKLIVLFDGACPLCQREIGWYRGQRGADNIEWVDVACAGVDSAAKLSEAGLSREQALQRFHIQNAEGEVISGGKAFITLWSALPRFRALAKLLALPPLAWITERFYDFSLLIRPTMQRAARKIQQKRRSGD